MNVRHSRLVGARALIGCLALAVPAWAQNVSEAPESEHRLRPFMGVGAVGYNFGLEAEYALLPYLSLLGGFQAWLDADDVRCLGGCPAPDEGWGLATGIRLSSDWELPWGFFLQAEAGFYSFTGRRVSARPSFGGRTGVYAELARSIEIELGIKYQHVVGDESGGVRIPNEDWGGLVVGFAVPVS